MGVLLILVFVGVLVFFISKSIAAKQMEQSRVESKDSSNHSDSCEEQVESITIPDGTTEIKHGEFRNFRKLTSIAIPNSVTSIGHSAFYNCSSLTSITIPDSVTSIGEGAFWGCSSLTSITIPNSITSIGKRAFDGCSSLKSFNGKFASEDGRCLIKDGELIAFAPGGLTSYTIPNSVKSIGRHAFEDCSSLTSITIPNSVTSIGSAAFHGCSSLKSVKVANKDCYDYFKYKVANIAFYGANASADGRCLIIDGELKIFIAKGITEYTIPNSVTSIGYYAFNGCSSLTSITIPNSVTSIVAGVFQGCSSLTSITIPESVTSFGEGTFKDCSNLKSVKVANKYCYDYFIGKVANIAFYGANASDDGRCLIKDGELIAFASAGLTSYTIPNSVTSIGDDAFRYCRSLTSITIPDSVTSIGEWAFSRCSNLTSITIPNSVTSIGDCAFWGCSSLTSITIPKSVTNIGSSVFCGCSNLTSINIPKGTNVDIRAFAGCSLDTEITKY